MEFEPNFKNIDKYEVIAHYQNIINNINTSKNILMNYRLQVEKDYIMYYQDLKDMNITSSTIFKGQYKHNIKNLNLQIEQKNYFEKSSIIKDYLRMYKDLE